MVAFGKKLRESQIQEWQGYVGVRFEPKMLSAITFNLFVSFSDTILTTS